MASQPLNEFLDKMLHDPVFRGEVVKLAAQHGIDFSSQELSEDELGGVAGGASSGDDFMRIAPDGLTTSVGLTPPSLKSTTDLSGLLRDTSVDTSSKMG